MAANSLDHLTGEARKQAEMQAALTILYDKTTDAQGQAAREADTYASKVGELNARMTDAKATIGESLLPLLVVMGDFFIDAVPDIERFFTLLSQSLDDPQVTASVSNMNKSLNRLGDSIAALFGSTEEDEAQGFVNFWTILSALVANVADEVNKVVAAMAFLTGNTKPMEELLLPYGKAAVELLGKEVLPALPASTTSGTRPNTNIINNTTVSVKTDATAQEIAKAVNKANQVSGTNIFRQ
jgi:hypothetical protein